MEEYTRLAQHYFFVEQMIEEQNELESYINECVILSNNNLTKKQVFQEMTVLNEADFGNKIKIIFNRLKSFFSKLVQRFYVSFQKGSDNKFLENYKDIILGKEFKLDITMGNHFDALKRVDRLIKPETVKKILTPISQDAFNQIIESSKKGSGKDTDEETKDKTEEDYKKTQYKTIFQAYANSDSLDGVDPDKSEDIESDLKEYFAGGSENISFTPNEIQQNMDYIYKYLYHSDNLITNIENYRKTFEDSMNKCETAYNTSFNKAQKLIQAHDDAIKNNTEVNSKKSTEDEKTAAQTKVDNTNSELAKALDNVNKSLKSTQQQEVANVNASYIWSNVYNTYLNEDITVKEPSKPTTTDNSDSNTKVVKGGTNNIDTKSAETNDTNKNKTETSTNKDIRNTGKDAKSSGSVQGTNAALQASGKIKDDSTIQDTASTVDISEFQTVSTSLIRAYSNTRTMMIASALNEIRLAQKEFGQLVKAHVNYYVGTIDNTDDNTSTNKLK